MYIPERVLDPEDFSEEELRSLRKQIARLRDETEGEKRPRRLVLETGGEDAASIQLPEAVGNLVIDTLTDLSEGRPVSVVDADEELTTREAAELLNVSRPHLTKLLKEGKIPSQQGRLPPPSAPP